MLSEMMQGELSLFPAFSAGMCSITVDLPADLESTFSLGTVSNVAYETVQVATSTTTAPDPYVVFIPGCREGNCPQSYTFTYRTSGTYWTRLRVYINYEPEIPGMTNPVIAYTRWVWTKVTC